ncbi:PTS system fructose-specific EIIB'BC component [bioreactor metagenome]|uniref:PTS system D-fructose-specific transporter subunit IIBC n=2 Tax=root TaxID=1 RepID=R9CAT8_9CLOT|nr:PTS D-fructose transporter subunit IIBC [Clostridium sartagoforme]EOR26489.1 PTS system D-fructose-specific transporter subunit IIBC [Clostridium sartagoforme AAU1]
MSDGFKKGLNTAKMHLNAGFNGMLPLIIVGAIGMALSSILPKDGIFGDLFAFLNEIGLKRFDVFIALIIGQSLSGKVGLASGFILGYYSNQLGLGIFGGIVVGFIAGYSGLAFNRMKLEGSTKALLSLVVLPVITAVVGFFLIKYGISGPVKFIQDSLVNFLNNVSATSSVLLAIILGLMFGFDLGGPINKTAGLFTMISLTEGIRGPITYAAVAYMLPSMAAGLAIMLDRKKVLFDEDEHVQGPSVFALGFLSLSEPALPMMFSDMKFMVPANMICSALVCGLIAGFKIESTLALGFLNFAFMNKAILGVIIYLGCLALLTSLILIRRKFLYNKENCEEA